MTRTAIAFPRESRSYSPCATHAREDRPARRTLRFSRFAELIPRRRIGLSGFSRFVSKSWQNDASGRSFVYMHKRSLPSSSPSFPSLSLRRPGPFRAGPRRADTGAWPGFGTRPAARLRRTRPGWVSACDRRSGFGTRPGFGAHDRARFRHSDCSTDPP